METATEDKEKTNPNLSFGHRFDHSFEPLGEFISLISRELRRVERVEALADSKPTGQHDSIQAICVTLDALRADLTAPYKLVVAGVQKAGKSMLLNSLLGDNFFPYHLKNVDGILSWIGYGEDEGCDIHYFDGAVIKTSTEEGREYIDQRTEKYKEKHDKIEYVQFHVHNENLKTFVFVNTPGLGDIPEVSSRTEEFFKVADAVLWVFDSTKIEQEHIAHAVLDLCRHYGQKIIAVLNKKDNVEKSGPEAKSEIESVFKQIFHGCYRDYFWFSALKANRGIGIHPLSSKTEEQRNNDLNESGYKELIDYFEKHFFGHQKLDEKKKVVQAKLKAQLIIIFELLQSYQGMIEVKKGE
jgi:GTPase SAR1 family protein